jgi:hypothetical protein
MTRSRWILAFLALFFAWSGLVGWFAARWGAVYARGRLPDPFPETVRDASQPEAPDVKLVVLEASELEDTHPNFIPHLQDTWGDEGRFDLGIESHALADDGLQVRVHRSDGFSGESVNLDLLHGPRGQILGRVTVAEFTDMTPPGSRAWKRPGGWILVSRRDWSSLSKEHPLYVRFHLVDGAEPFGGCIQGFVRVPR